MVGGKGCACLLTCIFALGACGDGTLSGVLNPGNPEGEQTGTAALTTAEQGPMSEAGEELPRNPNGRRVQVKPVKEVERCGTWELEPFIVERAHQPIVQQCSFEFEIVSENHGGVSVDQAGVISTSCETEERQEKIAVRISTPDCDDVASAIVKVSFRKNDRGRTKEKAHR